MKIKNLLINLFLFLCALTFSLGLGEGLLRVYYRNEKSPSKLYDQYKLHYQDHEKDEYKFQNCAILHPYLGSVQHEFPGCPPYIANNVGFSSRRDMPEVRDPNFFNILVVGGSVAHQLSEDFIERELNQNYISPNKKPFRVILGAIGGGSYPQQNIVSLLYGERADAVVAIDGYTEALHWWGGDFQLGGASPGYKRVIKSTSYYLNTGSQLKDEVNFQKKAYHYFKNHWILKHSYLGFFIYERVFLKLALFELNSQYSEDIERSLSGVSTFSYKISKEKQEELKIKKYQDFVITNAGIAKSRGQYYAHFLQPVRWLYKDLTEKEKSYHRYLHVDYYKKFIEASHKLNRRGYPSFSLVRVFEGRREEFYGDHIHCKKVYHPQWGMESPGYQIMAKKIGELIAKSWKLKKK